MTSQSPELFKAKMELLSEIGKRLCVYGFPKRPSGHAFRKKTDFGHIACHLNVAEHPNEFSVAVEVAVRFDEVENLVNACRDMLSLAEKKKTSTIGCELGNLGHGRRHEYAGITPQSDISRIAGEIANFAIETGFPYFERFCSKEAVYAVLTSDDPKDRIHSFSLGRAERAVALAFLLHGRVEAAQIIRSMEQYMRDVDPRYVPLFANFVTCFKRQVSME
jgi:hypothetical protein